MSDPIITLTTDFGGDSPYVAAMKGVILGINPQARLIDLTHQIPPQDVHHAAFFLAEAVPFFPAQAVHVVVVDPGVGSERSLLYVEASEHRLILPDNGAVTLLESRCPIKKARRLSEPRYWRNSVSATFHGRDMIAPAAAHLSLGLCAEQLGPSVESWVRLPSPEAARTSDGWCGEVLFVDHFGNLLTNLPTQQLPDRPFPLRISATAGGRAQEYRVRRVRAYGDGQAEELIALVSSGGWWEFAVVNGNAAQRLGVQRGSRVQVVSPAGPT